MEALSSVFASVAGAPAIVGLFAAALIIFLTSDWRLSLGALLIQYLLVGLTLTRFIQPEVALVKILVGLLTVPILYLSARGLRESRDHEDSAGGQLQVFGLTLGWDAGPLGFPLRLLSVLLVVLALIRLFGTYRLTFVSTDIAFVAIWLASMGMCGLVLGGGPMRVAPALLTTLAGFDLVYTPLEPSLAVVGFLAALTLLTALANSYLIVVQGLRRSPAQPDEEETEP